MGKDKDNKTQGIDGNYIAEKKDNGKYTIKDVPIFAEVKEEGTKVKVKVTPDTLQKIVDKAQLRATEKYFSPLHLNHHSADGNNPNNNVIKIGFFIPTRVGEMTYEGESTSIIFADLFGIEEHIFEMIKDVRFPYRSVEAKGLATDDPEIASLALLEHDTPFFRLPLLTIKQEIDKSQKQVALGEQVSISKSRFTRAYQNIDSEKHLCRVLFSLGGMTIMSNKTKFEEEKEKEKKLEEEKEKEKLQEEEKENEKKLQEDEEKKDKEFEDKPDDEKINALYGLFKDIMKQIKGTQTKAQEEEKKPEEKLEDDPEKQKKTGPVELKLSRLEGEVVGLKDILGKVLNKQTKKDLIEYGEKKLAKFNLTDVKKKLEPFAKQGKESVDNFIAGVEERGTTDPSISFDIFNAKKIDNDPLMIEFAQKDPKIYAKAVEANTAYKALGRPDIDRKSFIENFMATDGSSNPVEQKVMV